MADKLKHPVACERGLIERIASITKPKENPERLALMLSRLSWLLEANEVDSVTLTFTQLQKRLFQWLSVKQVEHGIYALRDLGLILTTKTEGGVRYSCPGEGEPISRSRGEGAPGEGEMHLIDENSSENLDKQASPVVGKHKASNPLPEAELRLPQTAQAAWQVYKDALAAKNKSKTVSSSRLAGFLTEFLDSAEKHGFTPSAIGHGILACVKASDGPADSDVYFRKAAAGYDPNRTGGNGLPVPEETDWEAEAVKARELEEMQERTKQRNAEIDEKRRLEREGQQRGKV